MGQSVVPIFLTKTPNRKRLGAVSPAADTETVLYTVPTDADVTDIIVYITNTADPLVQVRLGVSTSNSALTTEEFILFEELIAGTASMSIDGIELEEGDELRIQSDRADTAFNVYGTEFV